MISKQIVQVILYRRNGSSLEFLYLKRSPKRGDFWTAVNGTVEPNEPLEECAIREVKEETALNIESLSPVLYQFSFDVNGKQHTVNAYAAEVNTLSSVTLNDEHTGYEWLKYNDALRIIKYSEDKEALLACNQYLQA